MKHVIDRLLKYIYTQQMLYMIEKLFSAFKNPTQFMKLKKK